MGHSRRIEPSGRMSALPPIATFQATCRVDANGQEQTSHGSHPMTPSAKLDRHLGVLRYQACAFLRGSWSDN